MIECLDLVKNYIKKALSTNSGRALVMIAVSSLVQRYLYVLEIKTSNLLAVIPWNDAVSWALFGVALAKEDEESTSLYSRISLRRSLQQILGRDIFLPLDSVKGNDAMSDWLFVAITNGDVQAMKQAMIAEPIRYTWDELCNGALLNAAQSRTDILPFLSPRTALARDTYQRTPLHWASLNGREEDVELLLSDGKADAGVLDWLGCTPLHCAVMSFGGKADEPKVARITKALLRSNSAGVNVKDSSGLKPLHLAILRMFYDKAYDTAEILLQHGAILEKDDYEFLTEVSTNAESVSGLRKLFSKYDHSKPSLTGESSSTVRLSFTPDLEAGSNTKAPLSYSETSGTPTNAALLIPNVPPETTKESIGAVLPMSNQPLELTSGRPQQFLQANSPPAPNLKAPGSALIAAMPPIFSTTSLGEPSDSGQEDQENKPPLKKRKIHVPWTPAEEQRLKVMRDAGNSWTEIAKVTR